MDFDFRHLSTKDCYKIMCATVVPRPIAWVVTKGEDGSLNAAPYSFFNALSIDPPMLAICVGNRDSGGAKDTSTNIRRSGQFVVNMVSEALAHEMNVTSAAYPAGTSEIDMAKLRTTPSSLIDPPRITESPVAFECQTFQTIHLPSDRDLILGRILLAHVRDDCVLDASRCYIDTPKLGLIGRMHGGGWYIRTTDWLHMPRPPDDPNW